MKKITAKKFMPIILAAVVFFLAAQPAAKVVFEKSKQTLGDTRSFGVAIDDVDMDGDNDIFLANYRGPNALWLNDGRGVFTPSAQAFPAVETHGVNIQDLNGDGKPDIMLLNHAAPSQVLFNDGSGKFVDSGQKLGAAGDYPSMAVLGDVDGDGDADAFVTNYQVPNRLWLNDSKGFFTVSPEAYGGANGHEMELADFNGDGSLDLYLSLSDQADQIWFNDGAGRFKDSGQALGGNVGVDRADYGDVDGDGDIDLVIANGGEGLKIWLNRKNTGTFVPAGPSLEAGLKICKLFDADRDSDLDLITLDRDSGNHLWLNSGSGSFTSLGQVFGTPRALSVACGDLDGNGIPDVVLGKQENTGGNGVYFNRTAKSGPGTALAEEVKNVIRSGELPALQALVEKDPGLLKTRDSQGRTLLHLAAVAGHLEMVRWLIGRGVEVDARTAQMSTPLMHASLAGKTDIVRLLLARGADIGARDS
ncbi:MAG: hypothetical protein E4H23_10245, partial [Chrysiogenales bacterium]